MDEGEDTQSFRNRAVSELEGLFLFKCQIGAEMRQRIPIDQLGGRAGAALHALELLSRRKRRRRPDRPFDTLAILFGQVIAGVRQRRKISRMDRHQRCECQSGRHAAKQDTMRDALSICHAAT